GHLVQQVQDLGGGQFALVLVVEVAVDATFVAAVREVQMRAQGNAQFQGADSHLLHQAHGVDSPPAGWSDSLRMPCSASSDTSTRASASAVSGSTSTSL